jgi:hypothetical protein
MARDAGEKSLRREGKDAARFGGVGSEVHAVSACGYCDIRAVINQDFCAVWIGECEGPLHQAKKLSRTEIALA